MKVRVRYFASLREALGGGEEVDVPAGASVAALRDTLLQRSHRHAELLDRQRAVRCAVDQSMADEDTVLHDGAEVAFFPPVTGG
jgi:molybdopterin synthase sulfur carrier subunit